MNNVGKGQEERKKVYEFYYVSCDIGKLIRINDVVELHFCGYSRTKDHSEHMQ